MARKKAEGRNHKKNVERGGEMMRDTIKARSRVGVFGTKKGDTSETERHAKHIYIYILYRHHTHLPAPFVDVVKAHRHDGFDILVHPRRDGKFVVVDVS